MSLQTAKESGRVKVGIADAEISTDRELLTTSGVGSCLGVALFDREREIGGLVHIMLPKGGDTVENEWKYADTGIEALVNELEKAGVNRDQLVAKVAGGSDMLSFQSSEDSIGERNIEAVRSELEEREIPLEAEDVGGNHGRSIEVNPAMGSVQVTSAKQEDKLL